MASVSLNRSRIADDSIMMFSERVFLLAMLLHIVCEVTTLAFRCFGMLFSVVDVPRVIWRVFL